MDAIESCTKNDPGFKKKEKTDDADEMDDEIAESFKRQNDLLLDKKKNIKSHLSVDSWSDEFLVCYFFNCYYNS